MVTQWSAYIYVPQQTVTQKYCYCFSFTSWKLKKKTRGICSGYMSLHVIKIQFTKKEIDSRNYWERGRRQGGRGVRKRMLPPGNNYSTLCSVFSRQFLQWSVKIITHCLYSANNPSFDWITTEPDWLTKYPTRCAEKNSVLLLIGKRSVLVFSVECGAVGEKWLGGVGGVACNETSQPVSSCQ